VPLTPSLFRRERVKTKSPLPVIVERRRVRGVQKKQPPRRTTPLKPRLGRTVPAFE
jgi:hypothetical protein